MTRASSSLSGDEVAALMDELSDISFGDEDVARDSNANVIPFALGQRKERPTADLALIERMNERLGRRRRTRSKPAASTSGSATSPIS